MAGIKGKGINVDYNTILEEIVQRDANDSNRRFAPLRKAEDGSF